MMKKGAKYAIGPMAYSQNWTGFDCRLTLAWEYTVVQEIILPHLLKGGFLKLDDSNDTELLICVQ